MKKGKGKLTVGVLFLVCIFFPGCATYSEGFADGSVSAEFSELRDSRSTSPNQKDVFLILPFENLSGFDFPAYETLVRRYLQTGLVQTGMVDVVDRDHVEAMMEELNFQLSGLTENDSVIKIGEMLNAKYAVTGSILEYSSRSLEKGVSAGIITPGAMSYTGANVGVNVKTGKVRVSLELNILDLQTGRIIDSFVGTSEYISKTYSTDMDAFNTTMMALTNGSMLKVDVDLLMKFDDTIVGKTTRKAVIDGLKQLKESRA